MKTNTPITVAARSMVPSQPRAAGLGRVGILEAALRGDRTRSHAPGAGAARGELATGLGGVTSTGAVPRPATFLAINPPQRLSSSAPPWTG